MLCLGILGVATTFAGGGGVGTLTAGHRDGVGTQATFNVPKGIAVDTLGVVFVADFGNNLIRKITLPNGLCQIVIIYLLSFSPTSFEELRNLCMGLSLEN